MISVVIPTWEAHGMGVQLLERALDSIESQTYKDVEIVISDNSEDDKIKNLCKDFFVNYFRNPKKGMANNTNYAIDHATGDLIKILYQDDWLAHERALDMINEYFEKEDQWMITGSSNNENPVWTDDIWKGNNKLGSPSSLTIRNAVDLRFNNDYKYVLDCEYYKRLHDKYGEPRILYGNHVNIGIGDHQETNNLTNEVKIQEIQALIKKYA